MDTDLVVALEHAGVTVFRVHKNYDPTQGLLRDWFTTNPAGGPDDPYEFDVRETDAYDRARSELGPDAAADDLARCALRIAIANHEVRVMNKWTFLFKLGHSFFADERGRIGVADDSGANPDLTDDGALFVDRSEPVRVGDAHAAVTVTDEHGGSATVMETPERGLVLAHYLGMKVNARGLNFRLVPTE